MFPRFLIHKQSWELSAKGNRLYCGLKYGDDVCEFPPSFIKKRFATRRLKGATRFYCGAVSMTDTPVGLQGTEYMHMEDPDVLSFM